MYGALATPVVIIAYIAYKVSQQPPPPIIPSVAGVTLSTVQALIAQAIANVKAAGLTILQVDQEIARIVQTLPATAGLTLSQIDAEISKFLTSIPGGVTIQQVDREIANALAALPTTAALTLAQVDAEITRLATSIVQNAIAALPGALTLPAWLSQDAATTLQNLLNAGPPALLSFSKDPLGYISASAKSIGIAFKGDVNGTITFINTNIIDTINNVINSIPLIPHPQLPHIPTV